MKKSIIIGVIILLAVLGFMAIQKNDHHRHGHNHKKEHHEKEHKVATTIFPLFDMTQRIAGDEFEVVLVLPSGASPHTFDPQPSLVKELQGSQAIFAIGHGLDNWATTIARSINAPIVVLDKNIELRASEEGHDEHDEHEEDAHDDESDHEDEHNEEVDEHHDDHAESHDIHDDHDDESDHEDHSDSHDEHEEDTHEGHDHGPIDPHYWLSIHNAEQITLNIAYELSELDIENADIYEARAEAYIQELEQLEEELKNKTAPILNKNIISLHDAWYYFAEEFDLNLVGTFEPSAGKEPTPGYIANLKEEVEEHNVSTLFIEPQLSQSSIISFTNDHDLGVAIIDPLGGIAERNSYIELMRYNVDQVVTALTK